MFAISALGGSLSIFNILPDGSLKQASSFSNTGPDIYEIIPGIPNQLPGFLVVHSQFVDLAISGQYVYPVATGPRGLRMLDISDTTNPREIGSFPITGGIRILVQNNLALLTTGSIKISPDNIGGYKIGGSSNPEPIIGVDISNLNSPQPLFVINFSPTNYYFPVVMTGNYIYRFGGNNSISSIEIYNLSQFIK